MIWLGEERGYLTDWLTQLWVKATGRRVSVAEHPWLEGPVGPTRKIGTEFFEDLARRQGLALHREAGRRGILPDFSQLRSATFDPDAIDAGIVGLYQETSAYQLDAWSEWAGPLRPFGRLLALLFSRRLQQLNVPLSGLDTSRGLTNEVWHLAESDIGDVRLVVWLRRLVGSGDVLYAGSYSPCRVPGYDGVCVKVAFPLPNGNALVFMRPEAQADGSLLLVSAGRRLGDPGFYFTVRDATPLAWARHLPTMRERIRVYCSDPSEARADHTLTIWRQTFLRLHYRLRRLPDESAPSTGRASLRAS